MKMKLKLILLSLIVFPILLHSQSKSSLDFVLGVDYAYRSLNLVDATVEPDDDLLNFLTLNNRAFEKGKINARFGLNYSQKITEKLLVKSGLRLAEVGYLLEKRRVVPFGGDPLSPVISKKVLSYYFLEIPLAIRYNFAREKLSFFVEAGMSPNFLLTTRLRDVFDREVTNDNVNVNTEGVKRLQWVGSLSAGINYDLNESWQLFGQPIVRYHLTSTTEKSFLKQNLYSLGVELGVRKLLK
jgi:hypothetical protein